MRRTHPSITLVLEGTYPYVQGGVSSWTHTLIRTLSQCEFSLLHIGALPTDAPHKYKLPDNVVELHDVYLHTEVATPGRLRGWNRKAREETVRFLKAGTLPSRETLQLIRSPRHTPTPEAVLEEAWAWEAALEVYATLPTPPALVDFVWNWRSMWLPLLRLIRAPLPTGAVMHAPSTGYAGWYGAVMHRLTGKPLIITEHGIYTREREEEIVRAEWVSVPLKSFWNHFFARMAYTGYEAAKFVTTLSEVNQRAQRQYGTNPAVMHLIPNGVSPEAYAHIEPTPGRPFTVGAILRVVPIKDVKTLLRAFAVVLRHLPEARLMLIGPQEEDPEYYEECLALVDSLGIAYGLEWTGPVNVMEYLPRLDCIVLTSISEGQPLVMLEAMAAGLPVIATDVGGCRELVEGVAGDALGRCGRVTKVMSPEETGAAIVELAHQPELRAEMGRIGRARVRQHYDLQQVMRKYFELYREAVMT